MVLSGLPEPTLRMPATADTPHLRTVAVIIPFFQKQVGILRRAMVSILGQQMPAGMRLHVFIIDDSSPLPPAQDLVGLPAREDMTWSVHHQLNAGPGAARNRGLDLADATGTDFVALLDSDDEWLPQHLSDAIAALDQGYGFYFCNHTRSDAHVGGHVLIDALKESGAGLKHKATVVSTQGPVLGFGSGALAAEMIAEYLCQTSCVVMRAEITRGHRFDTDLRAAGEDHLYWVTMAIQGSLMVASWRANVVCGQGLNLYFSALDWNVPATIDRLGHLLLMCEKLRAVPSAVALAQATIEKKRRMQRRGYAFLFVRSILRGQRPNFTTLKKIRNYDPLIVFRLPVIFAQVMLDRRPETKEW